MSNYDNVDWTGTAINQKNRGAILDYALSPEGQAYQKEYDTQAKIGKVIAGNEDIINPGAFQGNPSSRYEATKYNTADTPSVGQIIDYMMRSGTTSKDVLEFVKQSGDERFTATGKYSLDPEGKLSRKYSYHTEDTGKKWYDFSGSGLLSGLTLGLSDVVKGHMPGTDWADQGILTQIVNPASQVHSMFTGGAADLVYGIDKAGKSGGSFWDKFGVAADRAIDPFGVDPATRATGEAVRDINPEAFDKNIAPYLPAVGAVIGTLVYPAAGTAGGYGIGTKLAQGHRNYDYLKDLAMAAAIYATYGMGSGAGGAVQNLTGSAVLGGITSGAVSGAMSGVPSAIQQKSWNPLWQGALAGGVAGGIGTGARIGAYGLGASKAIANLTGKTAGSLASTGMKRLWLNRNS
jgi:hypothetical protein